MKRPTRDPRWSPEVEALYRHDMQEIWDPTLNQHIWQQYHNQLDIYFSLVSAYETGLKFEIMDVGCAQATLAMMLAERGHKVVAVDLRQPFLDYARTRYTHGDIEFLAANVLEMELNRQFDIIFANQIIEHLVYPAKLVGRLKALLKPQGCLVVTTPNWHYIKNDLPCFADIGDPSDHESKQFTADADGHFFAYRADELVQVFRAQGFDSVTARYFETPIISGHMKFRHIQGNLPTGLLRILDRAALTIPFARNLAHQLMILGRLV